jgi:hypothetical protein
LIKRVVTSDPVVPRLTGDLGHKTKPVTNATAMSATADNVSLASRGLKIRVGNCLRNEDLITFYLPVSTQ